MVQKTEHRQSAQITGSGGTRPGCSRASGRAARDSGDFKAFCEAVSLHPRKAYDLIAIADAVEAGRLQGTDVQEIGWSKARLIAEHAATKGKAKSALGFARKNTLAALAANFQGNGTGAKLITKSFNLTAQQAKQLETALVQAGRSDAMVVWTIVPKLS